MTTLPDRRVKSSPQQNKTKLGLDVGKSQKWPCQHLGLFKIEFSIRKKKLGHLHEIVGKKLIGVKKVTALPI